MGRGRNKTALPWEESFPSGLVGLLIKNPSVPPGSVGLVTFRGTTVEEEDLFVV